MRTLVLFLLFCGFASGQAIERLVPRGYSSIQAAINASRDGETITVSDGTYVENLNFKGKDITVESENGAASCVIDGGEAGPVVKFVNGETNDAVLSGFQITNGSGIVLGLTTYGGGIYIYDSEPEISDCWIHTNTVDNNVFCYGGGIYALGWDCYLSLIIKDNKIYNNYADDNHPAMSLQKTSFDCLVQGNEIYDNDRIGRTDDTSVYILGDVHFNYNTMYDAGDLYIKKYDDSTFGGVAYITDNLFYEMKQVELDHHQHTYIIGNTFADMTASNYAFVYRGNAGLITSDSYLYLYNNIFWDQGPPQPAEHMHLQYGHPDYDTNVWIEYCCVEDGAARITDNGVTWIKDWAGGTDNIETDPDFEDAAADDYHISTDSGCKDTGLNTAPEATLLDFEGDTRPYNVTNDIGADERDS